MLRPYNDPEYRRASAALKANPRPCALQLPGCTGHADTLDHQPRITDHTHRRDTGCCTLVPACRHCNSSDGGKARARMSSTGYTWP